MKRRKLLFPVLILLLVGVGCGSYVAFFRDTTPVANTLPTSTPAFDSTLYGIDLEESEMAFLISANTGDINATFKMQSGTIELKPEGEGWRVVVNFIFDNASADSGNRVINFGLKLGMEVEKYPYGIFTGESQETLTDLSEKQSITLVGSIEAKGVTIPKTATATIYTEDTAIYFDARIKLDMTEFGGSFPEAIGSNVIDATVFLKGSPDITPVVTPVQ